uniref:Retrovirus-related Pol polyprotein from transposon 17.6 n=1 Tax=Cajanus cajan TaxID=3821 RepID=A0A151TPQ0_CAJCA|nr:hypothetical protein KK1_022678 [Cajanus cajan]
MPFGLTNALASFQALMNHIFQPFLRQFVLVFLHQLHVKLAKCVFGTSQIAYLSHVVSSSGVFMDPDKVSTVIDWPPPHTLKQLCGFLGLTSYYRRFIRGYASLEALLHYLLQKDVFCWNTTTQMAFEKLEQAINQALVLSLPNFTIVGKKL